MPTGYTAKLMESGESFNEFVMRCARAMGACVTMREDPQDKPIPEKFEPSDWHQNELAKDKEQLEEMSHLTDKQELAWGEKLKRQKMAEITKWLEKEKEENSRLEEMEDLVRNWKPPTPDHQGLKDFMLQQIEVSMNSPSFQQNELKATKAKDPALFFLDAHRAIQRSIAYHADEHANEVSRAEGRTKWVKQLRKSLK